MTRASSMAATLCPVGLPCYDVTASSTLNVRCFDAADVPRGSSGKVTRGRRSSDGQPASWHNSMSLDRKKSLHLENKKSLRSRGSALGTNAVIDWAAIPAWVVKALALRVYEPNPCGEGKYLDPRTQACVYVCREGYRFDHETKACVRVVGLDLCEEGFVLREGKCVPDTECDNGFAYDAILDACILPQGTLHKPKRNFVQTSLAWAANRLLASSDSCPVGFYHDPNSNACVPVCAPGYLYDRTLKKCVKEEV